MTLLQHHYSLDPSRHTMNEIFNASNIRQRMKFSIKDFFSKYDQIRNLRIWSHLLKKSLMENFLFCDAEKLKMINHMMTS